MKDSMQYDPIQGQGHKPFKFTVWPSSCVTWLWTWKKR